MLRSILRCILITLLFIGVLSLGGYTLNEFKHTAQIQNPKDVFAPLLSNLPEVNTPELPTVNTTNSSTTENNTIEKKDINLANNDSNNTIDDTSINKEDNLLNNTNKSSEIEKKDINLSNTDNNKNEITLSKKRTIKVTINGQSMELSSETTLSFIKWLNTNYDKKAIVAYEETTPPEVLKEIEAAKTELTTNESSNKNQSNEEITYNDILENKDDLDIIVDDIETVNKLEDIDGYDRSQYEKPVISYKLNGIKYNRNDYSWKTSIFLVSEEPFEYICPYTGQTITDDSKLDYDHIVPLHSTYIRGAKDWTDKQKNEYAYDQWVGIDVLNSANRSKSDKGPAEWLPTENVEDYCYTWLLICSKYDLIMTKDEVKICVDNINTAFENGETIERLSGNYKE